LENIYYKSKIINKTLKDKKEYRTNR